MLRAVKTLTYATRRLVPGDTFEAKTRRDERLLLATRKVEKVREPGEVSPPPPAVAAKIAAAVAAPASDPVPSAPSGFGFSSADFDDIAKARADYVTAFNRPPFNGWSAAMIRAKIAAKPADVS